MTPEERKAIAMRQDWPCKGLLGSPYPHCCFAHEGFDAALALLVPERLLPPVHDIPVFAIEATP